MPPVYARKHIELTLLFSRWKAGNFTGENKYAKVHATA